MKKIRKIMSLFLVLSMLFTVNGSVFATNNGKVERYSEIIEIDGITYETTTVVNGNVSRAIVRNEKNCVIADTSFNLLTGILTDNLENKAISYVNIIPNADEKEIMVTGVEDQNYTLISTSTGSLAPYTLGTAGLIAAILALVPGATTAVVKAFIKATETVVTGGILALTTCYYELDLYMAYDDNYDYVKRELRVYTNKACTNQIGPEIVGYQKKAN